MGGKGARERGIDGEGKREGRGTVENGISPEGGECQG